ncbi:hypothetical protein [Conchiformibius kuhniae]|uniref:DUF3149 domain-containing protein n=1 Tax=Conchiformibius kuhniae TaxID=211502 RepID=A0ABD8B7P1_9NEIS|nr:hypothetical protein [Conchiformibius kuhniae]
MEQEITFTLSLYTLVGGCLLGGIVLGVLLAVAFYKRGHLKDLVNEKL